jgi:HD-GYP domain-containing protein (c-di-GMP phosphodiesterase class II)
MRLVPIKYLQEDTQIAEDIINKDDMLLIKKGQTLTESMIESLGKHGIFYTYIKDKYCFNPLKEEEISGQFINECVGNLKRVIEKMKSNNAHAENVIHLIEIANKIIGEVETAEEQFKVVYRPAKIIENALAEQTINQAIMCTGLAFKMKWSRKKIFKLCLATLLKDISLEISQVTDENLHGYKLHPQLSYDYLSDYSYYYYLDEDILDAVLQHHEFIDGTGYPNRLHGEDISEIAKLIAVVDLFYELREKHNDLYDSYPLFQVRFNRYLEKCDRRMVITFLEYVEIFFPDTLVHLNNHDIAVVLKNIPGHPFKPIIKILESEEYQQGEIINLRTTSNLAIKNIRYYLD